MKDMTVQAAVEALQHRDPAQAARQQPSRGAGFQEMLVDSLEKVNRMQVESNQAVEALAAGRSDRIHETMIAMEKASISFNLMMQVRNKIIDAYNEIMKSSV